MIAFYILVFGMGFASDWLTMQWHRAREAGQEHKTALLSAALETLTWTPVIIFVYADDWRIALISIVASYCGTRAGLRRVARQERDSVIAAATATPASPPALQDTFREQTPAPEARPVPWFWRGV